ncbi:outer membrane beta-barrel protein [Daejeonella lutea]|uniref:Carboxypeptidase regulatory-like domain-containing protein n=1 Tax=Daejeonella lutea TaxID=572036 RepID=A0A1T5B2U0_9SPHI|nr:outer membrane beta-barrel protein [Daejeonella lutea]SKB41213.1 Carboxypeptidase regulatory-like domain-containing protein [Daejeonella lutea]
MRYSIVFLVFFLRIYSTSAQDVQGVIVDGETKKPLSYSTVAVYHAQDTSLISFKISDDNGNFKFSGLPSNVQLRLLVTKTGFSIFRKEFKVDGKVPLHLGSIEMILQPLNLNEVIVTAEIPPLIIRKDTLEFNASSFKTLPAALVEDLLMKLPGVQVDVNGNITVNGKKVNRILVDGKEFFGGDYKVATRNLPADMIDKVKVTKDSEVLERNPDIPDSRVPQVINLTLKKGIKKGLFGKIYGGGGVLSKYEGGGILNIFRDTTQISVLGYTNNLNRPGFGFADINRIGGFDRSGYDMVTSYNDGGFSLDDLSFGGTGEGRQKSTGAGVNFNTILSKKLAINSQYFYASVKSDIQQLINTDQTTKDGQLRTSSSSDKTNLNSTHRLGGRLKWQLDSLTSVDFKPSFAFKSLQNNQSTTLNTFRNFTTAINSSGNEQDLDDDDLTFSAQLFINKLFKKPGRVVSINTSYGYNSGGFDQFNAANNTFAGQLPTKLDQLRDNDRQSYSLRNTLLYTEPISKTVSTTTRLFNDYFGFNDAVDTWEYDPISGEYIFKISSLSEKLTRIGYRNRLTNTVKFKGKNFIITPGLQLTSIILKNSFLKSMPINQNFFYFNPSLYGSYKTLEVAYSTSVLEPQILDLQPVSDNTNPLFIITGNPNLKPTLNHSFSAYHGKYLQKITLNYSLSLSHNVEQNSIIRDRTISNEGIQTVRPVNTNGVQSWYGQYSFFKHFTFGKNKISIGNNLSVRNRDTYVILNSEKSKVRIGEINPNLQLRINLRDLLELNQTIGFTNQNSKYQSPDINDIRLNRKDWKSDFILRYPKNIVWESSVTFRYNSDVPPGFQKTSSRLNGAVGYSFMKNRALMKLSVYDLLDQNINTVRTIRENLIEDRQSSVLNRYTLLTFTYNIRDFGTKKGGLNQLIQTF